MRILLALIVAALTIAPRAATPQTVTQVQTFFTHATDCTTGVTTAVLYQTCLDLDDGTIWTCTNPAAGGASTVACDTVADWLRSGGGAASGLQPNFAVGNEINTATAARKFRVGDGTTYMDLWAEGGTIRQQVTPAGNADTTLNTGFSWRLFKNDGTTTLATITEAGAADFSPLTSFAVPTASGAAPTASGQVAYNTSSNALRGGFNGTTKDLATLSGAFGNDQCLKWSTASNSIVSTGAACGTGGGSLTPPITLTPGTDGPSTLIITSSAGAGAPRLQMGTKVGDATAGAQFFAVTPSTTNYALSGTDTATTLNASTSVFFATANAVRGSVDTNGLTTASQVRFQYPTPSVALQQAATGILEVNNMTSGQNAPLITGLRDAGTNTLGTALTLRRQSSASAASLTAGLGTSLLYQLPSTTTNNTDAVRMDALWTNATHASRTANLVMNLVSAGTMIEVARFTPTGLSIPATKSIYWEAGAMTVDGTNCLAAARVQINGGPAGYYFTCKDTNASFFEGRVTMPDSYTGGALTFELTVNHPTTEAATFGGSFSAQCRRPGTTLNNSWGTSVAADVTITTANQPAEATAVNVTPNGTCQGGDTLYWRYVITAGTFTTNAADITRVEGVKMEYGVLSYSD